MLKISGDVAIGHGCCRQIGLDSVHRPGRTSEPIISTPCLFLRLMITFCRRMLAVWWIYNGVGSLTGTLRYE